MFGGVTGKSASEQKLINKTFFFPVGTNKPKKWVELETKGVPPESRFHHSQHYYEKGNYMIVYGGRRFANPAPDVVYDSEFVNQIVVLRVDSLEWSEVKYMKGEHALDRFPDLYNFSTALMDDRIVIFGGMQGTYCQSKNCYSIELPVKKMAHKPPETPRSDDQLFYPNIRPTEDEPEIHLTDPDIV